ncbi:MAG: hypothetical protein ACUVV5_05490 [Candidatus Aminicenantales bacterium]
MKEFFKLLNKAEKKQLRLLSILLLAGVLFLLIISLGQRRSFFSLKNRLQARQKVLAEVEGKRAQAVEAWARWQASYRDIEELKKTYFYQGQNDLHELRLDLEKILAEGGVSAKSLQYDYSQPGKGLVDKVDIRFTFVGSYVILKKFLEVVERFPKFLMLEKIDFARISQDGSILELRIVLAGYYENL